MTIKTHWLRTLLGSSALVAMTLSAGSVQAELAADWQSTAMQLIKQEKWPGVKRQRGLAILHAAMFEAANAVTGTYAPYVYSGRNVPSASEEAAVTQAALHVMSELLPSHSEEFAAFAALKLALISDPVAREAGIALGTATAQAVLDLRVSDNADYSSDYTPQPATAGTYQPTSDRAMVGPRIREMKPFVLANAELFPVPPPPSLQSMQYQRDLAEVVALGGKSTQTDDKSKFIALLHSGSGSGAWNQIATSSSKACKLSLLEESRTLALLNFALTDALISGFNAKYEYALWRPETAVAALGKTYQHPDLEEGLEWESLVSSPMHPEYPCQHCTSGSAAQEVMESVFGDSGFEFEYNGKGGLTKTYQSFQQFAEEESESRVLGGVHYRRSNDVGDMLGYQIGSHIVNTTLLPNSDSASVITCAGSLSH